MPISIWILWIVIPGVIILFSIVGILSNITLNWIAKEYDDWKRNAPNRTDTN